MAKYTFDLRELVSTFGKEEVMSWFMDYELSDYLTPEEVKVVEDKGVWSKQQLADRILTHFYLREIGQEAVGAFILMAKDLMQELMESYAPLIYSSSVKFDPLHNVDMTETFDSQRSDTRVGNETTRSNGSGLTVNSDTPQGQVNKEQILQGKYASSTSANEAEDTREGSNSSAGNGNEHSERRTVGMTSATSAQLMIRQYREIIRALNTEIVYQLEPLFMGLY